MMRRCFKGLGIVLGLIFLIWLFSGKEFRKAFVERNRQGVKIIYQYIGQNKSKRIASKNTSITSKNKNIKTRKKYKIPNKFFIAAHAKRNIKGEIIIFGETNLPNGMKIWVMLKEKGKRINTSVVVIKNGRFYTDGFSMYHGVPFPEGKHKVYFLADLTPQWQPPHIMEIAGKGGKNFQGKLFRYEDPNSTGSDRLLDYEVSINYPPILRETRIIELVKATNFSIQCESKTTELGENLQYYFQNRIGLKRGEWSVKKDDGVYQAIFEYYNYKKIQQAVWSVNWETKEVKFQNKGARNFSCLSL